MARRRLRSLTIEGFTSIRSATVELGDVNVLIGPNGAGKSNFVSALAMLGRMADGRLNFHVRLSGGVSNVLYKGPGADRDVTLKLSFGDVWYEAHLVPTADDTFAFDTEKLFASPRGTEGPAIPVTMQGGTLESMLWSIGSGEMSSSEEVRGVAEAVLEQVQGCRVFHFHDTGVTSPMKGHGYAADNLTLHADAGNIAAVLLRLKRSEPGTYQQILRSIRTIAPFFRDFVLVEQDERIQLRWDQEGSEGVFPPSALSDGTLRFICLVTLLHLPEPPSIVVLDEPELGLHPHAIVHLAEMLYASSHRTQVILATQSVTLINQFAPEDLIIVERKDGGSTFTRTSLQDLQIWLEDYSLGELWQKNLIGGNPRRERGGT